MIAKEVRAKENTRQLDGLIDYMLDTEHDGDKVDFVSISGCMSDDVELAAMEMKLTQERNTRTKLDKTMHLVISFPLGEVPTREQLADIEQTMAEAVGMGKHQRISVAHANTHNYHVHIAINKIDPETYHMVNQYGNYRDLSKNRHEMERKHGLQITNADVENETTSNQMDRHAGELSLESWCKDNLKTPLEAAIQSANNWRDIHAVFRDAGLSLQKSDRGLAVCDESSGTAVKASVVSRQLSFHRLEKTLGPFHSVKTKKDKVSAYAKTKQSEPLFQQYQSFKKERLFKKDDALYQLKNTVAQQRLLAKTENRLKRQKIKTSVQSPATKKNIYKRLADNNRKHLDLITATYAAARKQVYLDHGNMTYQQYLCYAAAQGNEEALMALRRNAANTIKQHGLSGEGDKRITQFDDIQVDKHGVVAYKVGPHAILDNGKALTCKDNSLTADKQLLEMAMAKYGRHLTINGSDAFKARILAAADTLNIDVVLNGHAVGGHDPVQQFIANRNQSREQNKHIMHHARFTDQPGEFTYQGYRNIGQQSVVLLKQGHTLYVKEVSKKELKQHRQQKVGTPVKSPPSRSRPEGVELD